MIKYYGVKKVKFFNPLHQLVIIIKNEKIVESYILIMKSINEHKDQTVIS